MTICPDCSFGARKLGRIAQSQLFAGSYISTDLPSANLFRCDSCLLVFRWPRVQKEQLDCLYQEVAENSWGNQYSHRGDWIYSKKFIHTNLPNEKKVLDIGCFNGEFLATIKDDYKCFGIEINQAAANRAISIGVNIIGNDFSSLIGVYDCITVFDVIEHTESPKIFLENCLKHIIPGGYLIVSTGNADSLSFKLMRSKYWYCSIFEHISFICPSWFRCYESILGYKIISQYQFSRHPSSLRIKFKDAFVNLLYLLSPRIFSGLRRLGFGNIDVQAYRDQLTFPPGWGSANDHFIVVVQKI